MQMIANKKQIPNRCNTTLLLMYMFKAIITTPRMDMFTSASLRALNAQAIMNRFGMFFLQTQDSKSLNIPELDKEDPQDIVNFVTNLTGVRKKRQVISVDSDPTRTPEYPLGTHPTWLEITDTLLADPASLIFNRCGNNFWNEPLSPVQEHVIQLMCKFSRQYWFTLEETYLHNNTHPPAPESWSDVMNMWSVNRIQEIVVSPVFLPHKFHWTGLPRGRQQDSFSDRALSFFPPKNTKFPQ